MPADLQHGVRQLACSVPVQDELSIDFSLELATCAERAGYDWVFLGEIAGPEAFSLLGAMAARTERIGLATAVVSVYGRSPALLAMGFATLDALAPGRVLAGVGVGTKLIAEDWHDRPFEAPARRAEEVVASMRTLLRGDRVDEAGELAPVRRFRLMPATPHDVPMMVAAIRPRMLRVAGAVADAVYLAFCPDDEIGERVEIVRQGAIGAGRDPDEVAIALSLNAYAGDALDAADQRMRRYVLRYASLATHQEGFAKQRDLLVEALALAERGDWVSAADRLPAEVVQTVCAVGTPAEVARRVERCWDEGVDLVALHVLGAGVGDEVGPVQSVERVVRELRPRAEGGDLGWAST